MIKCSTMEYAYDGNQLEFFAANQHYRNCGYFLLLNRMKSIKISTMCKNLIVFLSSEVCNLKLPNFVKNKNLVCTVMVLESSLNFFGPCTNHVPLHLYHHVGLYISADLFCHKIHLMLLVMPSLCL